MGAHSRLHLRSQVGLPGSSGNSRGRQSSGRQGRGDCRGAYAWHECAINVAHRLEGMVRRGKRVSVLVCAHHG